MIEPVCPHDWVTNDNGDPECSLCGWIKMQIHPKFRPLLDADYTYANIEGGRAGMKTEQTARLALLLGEQRNMRICFARETKASMEDSSHAALSQLIYRYRMHVSQGGCYEVLEDRIRRMEGEEEKTTILFVGIRDKVRDKKGLHQIDLTVVEEAAKVSKDSLAVFIPTVIRKPGSRMWVVWNPEKVSDAVYQKFMLHPPPRTLHIHTTYLDNPWVSEETLTEAAHQKEIDVEEYEHIWLGKAKSELKGAIYQEEMRLALEEGRITDIPYNKQRPVDTAWDLGMGDPTCIWFVQAYNGYWNFIDFMEFKDTHISDILVALQQKKYLYGTHYLPHDGIDGMIHKKFMGATALANIAASPLKIIREAGMQAEVTTKLFKGTTIDAARGILPNSRFDAHKCKDGITYLQFYRWDREPDQNGKRKPYHPTSHGAEAYQVGAISIEQPEYIQPKSAEAFGDVADTFVWG